MPRISSRVQSWRRDVLAAETPASLCDKAAPSNVKIIRRRHGGQDFSRSASGGPTHDSEAHSSADSSRISTRAPSSAFPMAFIDNYFEDGLSVSERARETGEGAQETGIGGRETRFGRFVCALNALQLSLFFAVRLARP